MSTDHKIDDAKVFTVYSWFQGEMRRVGRKIKLPKCKDPTKTYQFRWTRSFVVRCDEWGLDDQVMAMLIRDIVDYAKRHSLLDRGTQMLSMGNVTDICYKGLKTLAADEVSLIDEVGSCHKFLYQQAHDKNNLVRRLIESDSGGCSNLLYWYNQGHLTEVYMALSKSCNQALSRLPKMEREELPSSFKLLRICTHTVSNDLFPKLRAVMGSDLRRPPTVTIK
jgi:hypothetical protein